MIDLVGPTGAVTMNDVITTLNVVMTSLVVWRQKDKDLQIRNRDETISWLREQLKEARDMCKKD
jgi:hypothetical protein